MSSVPLAELADVTMGQSPDSNLVGAGDLGLPFLQGSAEFGRISPTSVLRCARPPRRAKAGSILISVRAPVGEMNDADQDYCIGRGLGAFSAKPGVANAIFLRHAVELNLPWLHRRSQGSTFAAISADDLRSLPVPGLSLRRQDEIAAVFAGVDAAIEGTEALIDKHEQIKAGLMHDLFTRGIGASGELRPTRSAAPKLYREQSGNWIPEGWQFERLDDLALRGSGHTPNKEVAEYWNGGVKWVSLADSHRLDALYISDTELTISHRGIQNSSAVLHPAGIVVLSRDAGVGKSAITTEPMAVSQHFMCWKCDQRLDNHFLYYWLQFQKRTFENIAMGSTILTIGLPYFKKLRIACPVDLVEQRLIAARLKAADESLFALQRRLSKLRAQKLGLMQDLLNGRVSVSPAAAATELSHA